MPSPPNSLALETIADGSPLNAAPPRNNFSALQVAVNALIAILDGGTDGQYLKRVGATDVDWSAGPTGPVVTALPGSPTDGEEAVLVDSLTTPTYAWRFKYVASIEDGATDYKWLFVGGTPATVAVETAESTSSTSYTALTTAGPAFTLPRAGIYDIGLSYEVEVGGVNTGRMSYDIGGTGAVDADSVQQGHTASGTDQAKFAGAATRRKTGLTAVTLTAKYKNSAADGATYSKRRMWVTPVRVA